VLRRAVMLGQLWQSTARAALDDLADMALRRAGHVGLLEGAWGLRSDITFYDALYVAFGRAARHGAGYARRAPQGVRAVRAVIDVVR
jgi:predicted nucleic acid-binding protein